MRDYEVVVPATYTASTPMALSFVYHGAGGNEANAKSFGLQDAPGAGSASIFVYPQGINFQSYGVGWDDACGGRDVAFFDSMLGYLESNYCIDKTKIFVAGFSWGCDHVTALSCCRGDRIAAVGAASCSDEFSNSADYRTYSNLPCPVSHQAAIRFTHDSNGDGPYSAQQFASTSALYRSFNACTATSVPTSPSPCVSFQGCSKQMVECAYPGLGHSLPSGWGTDTWAFFSNVGH